MFEEYLDAAHKRVKRREKTLKGDHHTSIKYKNHDDVSWMDLLMEIKNNL